MWLRQLKAVVGNAVKVTLGDPFCLVLHLTGLALMCLLAAIPGFTFGEHTKLLRDQCLSLIFMLGSLIVVFGFIRVLTDDIRRGAGAILGSRPIAGFCIVAGKWLGVFGTVLIVHGSFLAAYLWTSEIAGDGQFLNTGSLLNYLAVIVIAIVLVAIQHYLLGGAYVFRANICLAILVVAAFGVRVAIYGPSQFDWPGVQSGVMLAFGLIAFSAFLLPVAILLDSAMVLSMGIVLFFFGLMSNFLVAQLSLTKMLTTTLQVILPNWQIYWVVDRISEGKNVPIGYFIATGVQAILLLVVALIAGTIVYDRMEMKSA